jgi:hypothetical protein
MSVAQAVPLLGGALAPDGSRIATAWVRPLCGDDEEWLASQPKSSPAAVVVTGLLSRTVVGLGPWEPPGLDALLDLAVADRDLLLLAVRTATYGDRFEVVLSCSTCHQPMDVLFGASDIPRRAQSLAAGPVSVEVADGAGGRLEIAVRPATGRDQEAVARAWVAGCEDPLAMLVARCVIDKPWDALPAEARTALPDAVEAIGPAIELAMDLKCPECDASFQTDLDLASYLLDEFAVPSGTVARELHLLARAYHWGLREIMSLPSPRRRALAALVSQEVRWQAAP